MWYQITKSYLYKVCFPHGAGQVHKTGHHLNKVVIPSFD